MTAQKSFKRLVRARMAKTGESYTAARAQLLDGADRAGRTGDDGNEPWLACSDDRIRERTGRGWESWFDLLDSWDAASMGHTEIARRVSTELDEPVLGWSAQAITSSFERSRGVRGVGQRVGADGYVAGASKTLAASADEVFAAFVDPARRAAWLPDVELVERTVHAPTRARFDVGDGTTRLLVTVAPKGAARSTVAVEQSRLAGDAEREERKTYWRAALASLQAEVERPA